MSTVRVKTALARALVSIPIAAAFAASPVAAQAAPKLCYETQGAGGASGWQDEACDGTLVAPSGGISGISITLQGAQGRHVCYNVFQAGAWASQKCDGALVGDGVNPMQQITVLLSPRAKASVAYTGVDANFVLFSAMNGSALGDGFNDLRVLGIRYVPPS